MHPSQQSRLTRLAGPVGLSAALLSGIVALSSIGLEPGVEWTHGPLSALWMILSQGMLAAAYVLGAFGWGRPFAALWAKESPSRLWLQLALGLAVMLSLSHLLGVLGLLSGDGLRPRIVGWGSVGIGVLLVADQLARGPLRPEKWPVLTPWAVLWAPALAVLLVAAANPPGHLWESEHRSYDEQSYHLQLPKEWAAGTRLWPTQHNVYSFLPSLVESAYLHLGTMEPGGDRGTNAAIDRLMSDEAGWVIGAHMLHALLAVCAALLIARAAWTLALRMGSGAQTTDAAAARLLGTIAGAVMLGTPWLIVTGSLGYNEAGMLAMMAGALLAAMDTTLRPGARGIICGLLVGVACGCKMTAAFMVAPVVGVLLLGHTPMKQWARTVVGGSIAGVIALAPWLIRNWLASGNPVFPFASNIFGTGHWTAEQTAKYLVNHGAEPGITLGGRIALLFSADRGFGHDQWWIVPWLGAAALAAALAWRRSHLLAAILGLGLILQTIAWLAFTHLQSRFLLPMLPVFVLLMTLAGAALLERTRGRGGDAAHGRERTRFAAAAVGVLALVPAALGVWSALLFAHERDGTPNLLLLGGPGRQTGLIVESHFADLTSEQQKKFLAEDASPWAYVNLGLRPQDSPEAGVFLLGDGAPLYYAAAVGNAPWGSSDGRSKVIYHTTWDTSPLGEAIRKHPDDPTAWTEAIRELGATYVLVNFDELSRLVTQNRYYDADVTPERVALWLSDPRSGTGGGLTRVRSWPRPRTTGPAADWTGFALFKIARPAARTGDAAKDARS